MRHILIAAALVLSSAIVSGPAAERSLRGRWCIESETEELIITFLDGDSVSVNSASDEGVNGRGTYTKQDTMFVATIQGDDLEIVMGYRYDWETDSTIEAHTLFMTINGDSINTPQGPVAMKRCGADNDTDDTGARKAANDTGTRKSEGTKADR